MEIEISTVKGFQDFLPPESLKRKAIKEIIEKQFRLYGFLPVETPVVEFDELMKPDSIASEDEAVSERFRLKDRAGRNLGLRYEFTFQLSRIFKENPNIKLPFRRYQIGEVFRDEPTGSRRFRQFTQCDADIVGEPSIDADVECLSLVMDILKELKIDAEIHVNNRKLLNAIIESVQISSPQNVMRELDKLDKIGEDAVKINLKKYADANQIMTLFKLLEKDAEFFQQNVFDGASELLELIDKCNQYKIKVKFNPAMIRGFSYYTGSIFEIKIAGQKETIAAGGRYDKVVGKYLNKEIPAVGISFGLDRIMEFANVRVESAAKVLVISLNKDKEAIKLSRELRKSSVSCIFTNDKPGKALEYANSLQIPFAIFIGEEETEKNKFKLKDMKSGDEKLLSEAQIIKALAK
jgi:histidyl-tRNA synthetase